MCDKRFVYVVDNGQDVIYDLKKKTILSMNEVADLLNEQYAENKSLTFKYNNCKFVLNDFIDILNKLQSNPTDEQLGYVARDMIENMGKKVMGKNVK